MKNAVIVFMLLLTGCVVVPGDNTAYIEAHRSLYIRPVYTPTYWVVPSLPRGYTVRPQHHVIYRSTYTHPIIRVR